MELATKADVSPSRMASIHARTYPEEGLEFVDAMRKHKHESGRMFPTWSEVLEVLQGLGHRKQCRSVTRENLVLLVWPYGSKERSGSARLEEIGPTRAVLASPYLLAPRTPARFCLIEPFSSQWVEAAVVTTERSDKRPHRVELAVTHDKGWYEILHVLGHGASCELVLE